MLPTILTSNVDEEDIAAVYGESIKALLVRAFGYVQFPNLPKLHEHLRNTANDTTFGDEGED